MMIILDNRLWPEVKYYPPQRIGAIRNAGRQQPQVWILRFQSTNSAGGND